MRVLTIVHEEHAGPGVFADVPGAELVRWDPAAGEPPPLNDFAALLVLGGAMNVHERARHPWLATDVSLVAEAVRLGVPTLGVCLGAQLLAEAAGGAVERAATPEIGWHDVTLTAEGRADPVTGGLGERFKGFQWHSYVAAPPADAVVLARSEHCLQAFRLAGAPAWGIQFHAEVTDADAARWTDDWESDADAVAMGFDPARLHAENVERMGGWHAAGRALFARFLAAAGDR